MKDAIEKLLNSINHIKWEYPTISTDVIDTLIDFKDDYEILLKKKRCDECVGSDLYNETLGIWICKQCDLKK